MGCRNTTRSNISEERANIFRKTIDDFLTDACAKEKRRLEFSNACTDRLLQKIAQTPKKPSFLVAVGVDTTENEPFAPSTVWPACLPFPGRSSPCQHPTCPQRRSPCQQSINYSLWTSGSSSSAVSIARGEKEKRKMLAAPPRCGRLFAESGTLDSLRNYGVRTLSIEKKYCILKANFKTGLTLEA